MYFSCKHYLVFSNESNETAVCYRCRTKKDFVVMLGCNLQMMPEGHGSITKQDKSQGTGAPGTEPLFNVTVDLLRSDKCKTSTKRWKTTVKSELQRDTTEY